MSEISQLDRDVLLQAFPQGVIAVDVETTGLSPLVDRVIELSAIKISPRSEEKFDELIDPEITIPANTIEIHGITNEMVKGKRKISDVLPEFIDFMNGLPLVAHNAKFDVGFLVFAAHQKALEFKNSEVYCSCRFSRNNLKEMPNHKLATLCKELDIKLENHHRALDDAIASLVVYARALMANKNQLPDSGKLFELQDFSKNNDLTIPKKLKDLVEYVETQRVINIRYKGGSMKGQLRPIKPLSLLPMPQGNILYAHCLVSNVFKSFSLKKISEIQDVDGKVARSLLKDAKTRFIK